MSLLYRVIYAAHANSTHHKLALDALQRLTRADSEAWQRLFLKHVELYLEGSKAPDKTFKDFKNHVLHVRDNYWGGAPEKVANWYAHLVAALEQRNWEEAVWCAGVLSHYYTDPIQPFHTAQSEAENNIHRAVEWSINRGYDALKREAEVLAPNTMVETPHGEDWLKDFVCRGAEKANAQYERLIAHYDFNIGVVDPPAGLDPIARDLIGDLILYAADGFARILERAIAESGATAPSVALSLDTVLATLKIPLKWVQKKLADAEDLRIVEAMYDELMETGRVDKTLSEDERTVSDLYNKEVAIPRAQRQAAKRAKRLPAPDPPAPRPLRQTARAPAAPAGTTPMQPPVGENRAYNAARAQPTHMTPAAQKPDSNDNIAARQRDKASETTLPPRPLPITPILSSSNADTNQDGRTARAYLTPGDDIEAAPSIGPKTAAHLYAVGIKTVAQFLDADPFDLADKLDARYMTAETIADWQDQAHLVMAVPGLRGTHAQLLVGAGYRSVAAIAGAAPDELSADILKFAATPDGQRVLREGNPPDIENIKTWVDSACAALAA